MEQLTTAALTQLPQVRALGRHTGRDPLTLFWTASGIELEFTGSELWVDLFADYEVVEPWVSVELNGAWVARFAVNPGKSRVCLFRGMTPGKAKHVRLLKDVQAMHDDPAHLLQITGLEYADGEFLPLPEPVYRLEFVGDSITSGEGAIGAKPEEDWVGAFFSAENHYGRLTADALGAEYRCISQSGWGIVSGWDNDVRHILPPYYTRVCGVAMGQRNAALGAQQENDFAAWQPDAVIVNLGTNDTGAFDNPPWTDPATGKPWKESWCYEHGIADYVAETAGEETLTPVFSCESEATGRDREDQPEYKVKMSAAFCFSNKVQLLEYYHNSSWLEHGGSPEHAVRTAFVYQINKYLKDKNLYKKGESAISFQDVQDCLVYVSSSFSTRTSYENQTKKAITNKFVSQAMTDFLKHYLEVYFLEKPEEAQKICQQVLVNKQSREHAEKTRQSIKKTLSTQIDLANRVQKFVDCRTKDASRRELYIVEGDSAMGAVKSSRDSEYQAIMPIRGKILNCLKADYARIFKSDVIVDLIKVMGCGVELGGKHNKELATFNLDNLRFNKIVICTDADVDGYQIRTLVLTMLYRLTPTLINEGYVYIAESPLYEITTKDRTYFAYTEPEKAAFLKEIGEKKYTIQRSKGLGENDPEMMWLTTMNPESRRLIKVLPTDVEETARVFDLLLGDNLAGRKEHIAEHGAEYLDDLDVS